MTHTQVKELVQALLDAPTSNPTLKEFAQSWINAEGKPEQEALTIHKFLVQKAQLIYYNTLKTLRQKALNSATALDARHVNTLSI